MNDGEQRSRGEYPAENARQGEIILKTRFQRAIFMADLVGFVLLAIIVGYWR